MAELTVHHNGRKKTVPFSPGERLSDILRNAGFSVSHPCGGRGVCKKCTVELVGTGTVLACRTELFENAEVVLNASEMAQIETAYSVNIPVEVKGESGFGAAIDIGTTTLVLELFDLSSGKRLASAATENPQRAVAADVMGRIDAALHGKAALLHAQITDAISDLLGRVAKDAGIRPDDIATLVCTGNTTMLYLLTDRNTEPLSHAPFLADTLFGCETVVLGRKTLLPPCMNAFVGADITCAVLACGMCERDGTSVLCDIGTNGEIALWHRGTLYVTSTAAGPAFEGAGISCGCASRLGAIDRVWVEDGSIAVHTVGDAAPIGICGSGLLDAIATGLDLELIDETGAMEEDSMLLADGVELQPGDVRAVQLAKGAIRAGIETLLETANLTADDVKKVYLAGGFGNRLNLQNAAKIGLIPESFVEKTEPVGNAALAGAVRLLLGGDASKAERVASLSTHVNLAGNPRFNEHFIDQMLFGDDAI